MQIDCHHGGAIPCLRYRSSIPMILEEIRNFVRIEILDATRVNYSVMNFSVSFYEKSYLEIALLADVLKAYVTFVHLSLVFASLKN